MPISRKSKPKVKKNRLDAFMSDLDNHDQDTQTPTPPRHSSRAGSSPNVVHDFMATLQQSDDEDEEVLARAKAKSSQAALDPVGLFDEENEERDRAVRSGKTKVKVSTDHVQDQHSTVLTAPGFGQEGSVRDAEGYRQSSAR